MWLPGSQSPSSHPPHLCLHIPAFPLYQLLYNLCNELRPGAGLTLTSLRRSQRTRSLAGHGLAQPQGEQLARAQWPGLPLYFVYPYPTRNQYCYTATMFQYLLIREGAIVLWKASSSISDSLLALSLAAYTMSNNKHYYYRLAEVSWAESWKELNHESVTLIAYMFLPCSKLMQWRQKSLTAQWGRETGTGRATCRVLTTRECSNSFD